MKRHLLLLTCFYIYFSASAQVITEKAHAITKSNKVAYHGAYSRLLPGKNATAGKATTASSCGNLDFEDLNYNGWMLFKGFNSNSLNAPDSVVPYTTPSVSGANWSAGSSFHAVIDSNNCFDPNRSNMSPYFKSNYAGKNIAR